MPPTQPFTQVNAFTDRPFAGNPAAVCLLPSARDAEWMQLVAREMNLAETAFLVREGREFQLRWFTPTVEVDLCGHATLASAHALWEGGHLAPDEAGRFQTRSGLLTAERRDGLIWLDFPSTPPAPADPPAELRDGLGVPFRYIGRTPFDYLVEVDDEAAVRGLAPDLGILGRLPVRGVIVTARAESPGQDFVSRFFAPAAGVPEDPVTGSAHCALAPYWAAKLGRSTLVGYQASVRGGIVRLQVRGNRVHLGGHAVTVLRGELLA
ncbi:MAG TPA: PhzF family phenazine biosynthesis protein [Gemmatimonadales bacterium]|nr:PhzF family phenazine biosynthesis protein [Gemmatimonadales bacterium]